MRLHADSELLDQLIDHMRSCLPEEGCGFLIGHGNRATRFLPAANARRSSGSFEVAPQVLFDLVRGLRVSGEDLVAICHSHPVGPASPSSRDVAEAHYPDSFYVIVSLRRPEPEIRVWRIADGKVYEAELHANI